MEYLDFEEQVMTEEEEIRESCSHDWEGDFAEGSDGQRSIMYCWKCGSTRGI